MSDEVDLLPDVLDSGMKVRSKTGRVYIISRTGERDSFDCVLYRLTAADTGIKLGSPWSRDQLQNAGVTEWRGEAVVPL